jgi:hypothetical protein
MMHGVYDIKIIRYLFLNNRSDNRYPTVLTISALLAKDESFSVSKLFNALRNEIFRQFRCLVMSLNITDDPESFNKKNRKQNVRHDNA